MPARNIIFALATSLLLGLPVSTFAAELPVEQDLDMAHLQVQAEQGDADAQFRLGTLYEHGLGVKENHQAALDWLRRAAEQGHVAAQSSLGALYSFDLEDLPADYALARTWLFRAAEQGNARAQYNLGVLYRDALGVERDTPVALKWFLQAAEQGDPVAQYNLGVLYENPGIAQLTNAIKWYRLSATQGFAAAQYNLALIYFNGNGVDADRVLGYALLMLAEANATSNNNGLKTPADEAAQVMQEEQVIAGRALASQLQENLAKAMDSYLDKKKTAL